MLTSSRSSVSMNRPHYVATVLRHRAVDSPGVASVTRADAALVVDILPDVALTRLPRQPGYQVSGPVQQACGDGGAEADQPGGDEHVHQCGRGHQECRQ